MIGEFLLRNRGLITVILVDEGQSLDECSCGRLRDVRSLFRRWLYFVEVRKQLTPHVAVPLLDRA